MPHELAAWGAHEKHYWSQYSADGRVRHCMCHAPVPVDATGRRTIRLFGGRKTMIREDNGGLCEPEACREYQQRQCNLTGVSCSSSPASGRSAPSNCIPTASMR
jgi:hypothetical protein